MIYTVKSLSKSMKTNNRLNISTKYENLNIVANQRERERERERERNREREREKKKHRRLINYLIYYKASSIS